MNLDDINRILGHSQNYPGNTKNYCIVQATCGKSSTSYSHQATSENIKEKILNGNSVNMKELGASTMEVNSDYVKPLQHSGFNMAQDLPIQRAERKHAHQIRSRPCFVPENSFKYFLARYPGMEEITKPLSEQKKDLE